MHHGLVNVVQKGLLLIGLLCAAAGCDGLSKEQR